MTSLMHCTAVFDETRRYRYSLSREWDTRLDQVCWVMLNPSIASSDRDDPTIRRCIDFSRQWGYGGLVVVNLFAYVTRYPWQLMTVADPIGEFNDDAIIQAISNRRVICAWGNIVNRRDRVTAVLTLFDQTHTRAFCLGRTRFGHPSHPVRLARRRRPRPFKKVS